MQLFGPAGIKSHKIKHHIWIIHMKLTNEISLLVWKKSLGFEMSDSFPEVCNSFDSPTHGWIFRFFSHFCIASSSSSSSSPSFCRLPHLPPSISQLMRHLPAAVPLLMNTGPHPVSSGQRNICLSSKLQTPRPLWYMHWLHCTFQLTCVCVCVDMYSRNMCSQIRRPVHTFRSVETL